MTNKTTLSITEARKNIFAIAEQVQKPGRYYTLTEKGEPKAVIVSMGEFESWAETLDIMRDGELVRGIRRGLKETKQGKTDSFEKVFGSPQKARP